MCTSQIVVKMSQVNPHPNDHKLESLCRTVQIFFAIFMFGSDGCCKVRNILVCAKFVAGCSFVTCAPSYISAAQHLGGVPLYVQA